MITAGIDIGSTTAKAVVLKEDNSIACALLPTGIDIGAVSRRVLAEACEKAGIQFEDLSRIVATGYGRISIPFATTTITEITCNAYGVHYLFPDATLVVDIGGQDSKVIKIDKNGRVIQFVMNDKCAAGTGKFLEVAAQTLGVPVDEIGIISQQSQNKVPISSTCTVFAQTEIVSLIARQTDKEDIAAGLHESIVSRVFGLISSVNPDPQAEVVLTGGVAKNPAIVQLLARMLGRKIQVPEDPQIVTALGAALLAREWED